MAALFESLKICEHLESVVKDTFGPCGLDVMLNSSSGKILITNSGGIIVNSLSVGHPVAQVVVDKIKSHNDIAGDGVTSFVLVLTQALREISKLLEFKGCTGEVDLKPQSWQTVLALSQVFMRMHSDLASLIQPTLDKLTVSIDLINDNSDIIEQNLKCIINTSLSGKFSSSLQKLLSSLLIELVLNNCSLGNSLFQDILDLIDDLPQVCVEFHGIPVQSSFIDQGFVISREFETGEDVILPKPGTEYFIFLVMQCALDSKAPENSAVMEVRDMEAQSKILLHNRSSMFSLLRTLKEQDIELLISSEGVSNMALHLCRQLGIAVMQMVPMETISYICKHTNVQPVCSISHYECQDLSDMFKGKGLSCKSKSISGQKYVQLCTLQSGINTWHIALCAPTQGISQQYCLAFQGALKCLKMSLSESRQKLTLLPGCGSVEFCFSQALDDIAKTTSDGKMATACKVLSKSLLQIPKMLHMNSHHTGNAFVGISQRIKLSWKEGVLLGVDGRTGDIVDPNRSGIYEPYNGKLLWLSHLLQCLSMLLRTDKIIGVKCLRDTKILSDSDSDD